VPSLNDGNIGCMFWISLQVMGWKSTCYSTSLNGLWTDLFFHYLLK
jgi:hypothetical protein